MSEKAPMPPWWVVPCETDEGRVYEIWGGNPKRPIWMFSFFERRFSNAKELADLIVQRTKHPKLPDIVEQIVRNVAELPDRTSPDDQPDMMLVTAEELALIIREHLPAEAPDGARTPITDDPSTEGTNE